MHISVIVPARNEESRIAHCIESILSQYPSVLETIVVANACEDRTAVVAESLGCRTIELPNPGVSRARNVGAAAARGEILLFIDADTAMSPGFSQAVRRAVLNGAVGGGCDTVASDGGLRGRMFWWIYNPVARLLAKTNGCSFYLRQLFLAAGGFPEERTRGEDLALHRRVRQMGRTTHLSDVHVATSMRRFERVGYIQTIIEWELGFLFPRSHPYQEVRP